MLLQVEVEVNSASRCDSIYGSEYFAGSMICVGPLAGGEDEIGRASCRERV